MVDKYRQIYCCYRFDCIFEFVVRYLFWRKDKRQKFFTDIFNYSSKR